MKFKVWEEESDEVDDASVIEATSAKNAALDWVNRRLGNGDEGFYVFVKDSGGTLKKFNIFAKLAFTFKVTELNDEAS